MSIRVLEPGDAEQWLPLRRALWPDAGEARLRAELAAIAADPAQIALGAFEDGVLIGFVELSLHPYAVGCDTSPVAYLEGWYVHASYRGRGVGRQLVAAGEAWARGLGRREMASDTWLHNDASHRAHLALGYEETERLIHYRKRL